MSDAYIDPPLEYRGDVLGQQAIQRLMSLRPGWTPKEVHLAVHLLEVAGRLVGEARVVASAVPKRVFRYYGRSIMEIPPIEAAPASTTSTWTAIDAAGYTIRAGTVVGLRRTGDELYPFVVLDTVVIPPGSTATAAGAVTLVSLDTGTEANDLPAQTAELIDHLAFVADGGIDTLAATAGGVDAETNDAYLDRLAEELRLMAPRPILPEDFAVLARRIPGVHRALAVDGYDPSDDSTGNERMVALALVDAAGAAVSAGTKAAVTAYLESLREVNFLVPVMDPTYTIIDVDTTYTINAGYVAADVDAEVAAALEALLSPGVHAGGAESPPQWRSDEDVVRYLEVADAINRVGGVRHIVTLTINEDGGVPGAADVPLDGVAGLPMPGAITVGAV